MKRYWMQSSQATAVVFLVIDTAGYTDGMLIGQINEAVESLKDLKNERSFAVAPLVFSDSAKWVDLQEGRPAHICDFEFTKLTAGGSSNLGLALELLLSKLITEEKGGWMYRNSAPIICFITDGDPTGEFMPQLERLKQRGWYKAALKFAIALGNSANYDLLGNIVGNKEAVISSDKGIAQILASIIRYNCPHIEDLCLSQKEIAPNFDLQDEDVIKSIIDYIMDETDDLF